MTAVADGHQLSALAAARQLVDFLSAHVDALPALEERAVTSHIGAALADCILQAGLSYNSVVAGRVRRIVRLFPEAATITGTIDVLSEHGPEHFLSWTHNAKIVRFTGLLCFIHEQGLESCADLVCWLDSDGARLGLLGLKGVGPKTIDYLCSLVGLDCVAVDRHMRQLSRRAGIEQTDYADLKLVISYAADLMEIPRRQFDWWLWRLMSQDLQTTLEFVPQA